MASPQGVKAGGSNINRDRQRARARLGVGEHGERLKLRDGLGDGGVLLLRGPRALAPQVRAVRPAHPAAGVLLKLACASSSICLTHAHPSAGSGQDQFNAKQVSLMRTPIQAVDKIKPVRAKQGSTVLSRVSKVTDGAWRRLMWMQAAATFAAQGRQAGHQEVHSRACRPPPDVRAPGCRSRPRTRHAVAERLGRLQLLRLRRRRRGDRLRLHLPLLLAHDRACAHRAAGQAYRCRQQHSRLISRLSRLRSCMTKTDRPLSTAQRAHRQAQQAHDIPQMTQAVCIRHSHTRKQAAT